MKNILIIDDEEDIRFLLREVLKLHNYNTIEAPSAEKGMILLKKEKVDLLLLDMQLPEMNGLEFVQEIRKENKELPVIIMTAFHAIEGVVEMMEEEVQGFIKKPFGIEEVLMKIEKFVGRNMNES